MDAVALQGCVVTYTPNNGRSDIRLWYEWLGVDPEKDHKDMINYAKEAAK
eukprot:COSAG01_NODE_5768_length_4046_cov_1.760578_7_plen_49_part_01